MATTARLLTYEDLLELPDDGKRYEIIDGELFEMASPSWRHQRVLRRFTALIEMLMAKTGLGELFFAPMDIRFTPHDIVQPDLVVLRQEDLHLLGPMPVEIIPILAFEVLSPSNREHDEERKFQLYAAAGVSEYWLADIEAKDLRGYILRDGGYVPLVRDGTILRSVILPGLEVDVPALFADLD